MCMYTVIYIYIYVHNKTVYIIYILEKGARSPLNTIESHQSHPYELITPVKLYVLFDG